MPLPIWLPIMTKIAPIRSTSLLSLTVDPFGSSKSSFSSSLFFDVVSLSRNVSSIFLFIFSAFSKSSSSSSGDKYSETILHPRRWQLHGGMPVLVQQTSIYYISWSYLIDYGPRALNIFWTFPWRPSAKHIISLSLNRVRLRFFLSGWEKRRTLDLIRNQQIVR